MNEFINCIDKILNKTLLYGPDNNKKFNFLSYLLLFFIPIGILFFIASIMMNIISWRRKNEIK